MHIDRNTGIELQFDLLKTYLVHNTHPTVYNECDSVNLFHSSSKKESENGQTAKKELLEKSFQ